MGAKSLFLLGCLSGVIFSASLARATDEKRNFSITGFFDGYYSYNFNNPKPSPALSSANVSSVSLPSSSNNYRYYDVYHNQLALSLAEVSLKSSVDNVTALIDFDFGSFADLNATTSSASGSVTDNSSKNIGQALITYHEADSRFTFEAGKMYSHMGVETVKSKDNFNYSRSILFSYAIPFWHTGVHVGYDVVPDQLQTSFYVYNGWNNLYDNNRSKTLGFQLQWTPSKELIAIYNFIGGPERADSESDWKTVHELNASLVASQTTQIIADFVYGREENALIGTTRARAQWWGGVLGVRYQLNQRSYISPRFEIDRDLDGALLSGLPQSLQSVTLTYGHELSKALETRVEARSDFSDQNTFATDSGSSKSQTTLLVAMLAHL